MFVNAYQKIVGIIKQWFEIGRLSTRPAPIPIEVQIDEAKHHRPMSVRPYVWESSARQFGRASASIQSRVKFQHVYKNIRNFLVT